MPQWNCVCESISPIFAEFGADIFIFSAKKIFTTDIAGGQTDMLKSIQNLA